MLYNNTKFLRKFWLEIKRAFNLKPRTETQATAYYEKTPDICFPWDASLDKDPLSQKLLDRACPISLGF